VVEFIVAIDEARVRFADDALCGSIQSRHSGKGSGGAFFLLYIYFPFFYLAFFLGFVFLC